eukprot:4552048-Prymnesium_polylepis.2
MIAVQPGHNDVRAAGALHGRHPHHAAARPPYRVRGHSHPAAAARRRPGLLSLLSRRQGDGRGGRGLAAALQRARVDAPRPRRHRQAGRLARRVRVDGARREPAHHP